METFRFVVVGNLHVKKMLCGKRLAVNSFDLINSLLSVSLSFALHWHRECMSELNVDEKKKRALQFHEMRITSILKFLWGNSQKVILEFVAWWWRWMKVKETELSHEILKALFLKVAILLQFAKVYCFMMVACWRMTWYFKINRDDLASRMGWQLMVIRPVPRFAYKRFIDA